MRSVVLLTCKELIQQSSKIQINLITKELFELPDLLRNASVDFIVLDHAIEREGIKSILLGYEINLRIRKKGTKFNNYFLDHDERDETTIKYLKLKSGAKIKRQFMDDIYGIIDGVRLGLGDAIVPKHLIHDMNGIDVVDEDHFLKSPVYLHFYDQPVQTKLFKVFLKTVANTSLKQLNF